MEYKIDYARIKGSITPLDVLSHFNIPFRKTKDTQFKAHCPLEAHKAASEKDKNNTFSVGLSKQGEWKWKCWSDSCRKASNSEHGGDCIDLMRLLGNYKNNLDAAKVLAEWHPHLATNGNGGAKPNDVTTHAVSNAAPTPPSKPLSNPPLSWEDKPLVSNPVHPEIQQRGITVATAVHWNVGYYEAKKGRGLMHKRIVFPLIEDGHLVGYAGRTTEPVTDANPKWLLPSGLKFTFLYGIERADPSRALIIVEACWEVLLLHQHGYQAAALLGTNLTMEQEARLEPFKTIWLMLDDDDAGHKATEKIADRLKPKHTVLKGRLKDA